MAYETILTETADGVLTITLNRPDVLNAVTDTMLKELQDALRGAERDAAVRCLVLTGAGRGFCAGQDLNAAVGTTGGPRPSVGDHLRHGYNPLVRRIRTIEKPVIAAVNGVAAGAGASLALACDIRIAGEGGLVRAGIRQDRPRAGQRRDVLPAHARRDGEGGGTRLHRRPPRARRIASASASSIRSCRRST